VGKRRELKRGLKAPSPYWGKKEYKEAKPLWAGGYGTKNTGIETGWGY